MNNTKPKPEISVSIMAHPLRRDYVQDIKNRIGLNCPVVMDNGEGIIKNCYNAWLQYDPSADYHIVLQDDAIPCEDFIAHVQAFLGREHEFPKPGRAYIYNLYFGNKQNHRRIAVQGLKLGYAIKEVCTWGVAICIPTYLIPEMLTYYKKLHGITQDDVRIAKWAKHAKIKTIYPLPSLVNHRIGPSLVGDPGSNRQAAYFIDDWNHGDKQNN